jgi:acyl-CoA synthetase (AMP-forming)/AMP-acid ligase II
MSRKHWLAAYGEKIPCEINPDAHGSVLEMLEAAITRFAGKPAFRSFGHTLTYADTDRLSRAFAAFLQNKLGVKKGDRIAVMLPNIGAFPLAMLGIVRAGGVQVNVNPLYTPRELEHQLNDAGVEIIVIVNGEPGEVCAKGPQVMQGYWQKPQANADAFTPDGYFRTGDIGVFDASARAHRPTPASARTRAGPPAAD